MSTRPTAPLLVAAALVFAVAVPACTAMRAAPVARTQPVPAACYAFRRQGRIWVSCARKSQPVSHHAYWDQYAVSPKGNYLAARGGGWALRGRSNVANRDALVIDLSTGRAEERRAPGTLLVPTCGTIELLGGAATDLISGGPLSLGHEAEVVACSNDRKVAVQRLAARPSASGRARFAPAYALYELAGASRYVLAQDVLEYAVSPGGGYVAFTVLGGGPSRACVERLPHGTPVCTATNIGGWGVLRSVSDQGALVLNQDADDSIGCGYRGVRVQKAPYPRGWDGDACPGVFYWRPSLAEPRQVQDLADEAQWIPRSAAAALIAGYKANRWPMF